MSECIQNALPCTALLCSCSQINKNRSGREVLENGQVDQICAINGGILQNGCNNQITKSRIKNLDGVKSILSTRSFLG